MLPLLTLTLTLTLALAAQAAPSQAASSNAPMRLGATAWRQAGVGALAVSPDGKLVATGGADGDVHIRRAGDGESVRAIVDVDRGYALTALAWGVRGVAAGSTTGNVVLLDAATGARLLALDEDDGVHDDEISALSFSADGTTLMSASVDGGVRVVRVAAQGTATPLATWRIGTNDDLDAGITRDGSLVIAAAGTQVVAWRVRGGERAFAIDGDAWGARCIALAPDARSFVYGGEGGAYTRVDVAKRRRIWRRDEDGVHVGKAAEDRIECKCAAFTPDGAAVVVADRYGRIAFLDARNGRTTASLALSAPLGDIGADHVALATSSGGRVWYAKALDVVLRWRKGRAAFDDFGAGHVDTVEAVDAVSLSPDGARVLTAGRDGTVRTWSLADAQPRALLRLPQWAWRARFVDDKRALVVSDTSLLSWDTTQQPSSQAAPQPLAKLSFIHGQLASASAQALAIAHGSGPARLDFLDVTDGRTLKSLPLPHGAQSLAISRDGARFALVYANGKLVVDGADAAAQLALDGRAQQVAWSPALPLIAVGIGDRLVLIDVAGADRARWREIRSLSASPSSPLPLNLPDAVAFSADGALVANIDAQERVRVWRVADGALLLEERTDAAGGGSSGATIAFTPDGTRVVAGAVGGALVWTLPTAPAAAAPATAPTAPNAR